VAFIFRSFLLVVVVAITWFSYLKHVESRDRALRVQDLRDCFQRREFASSQPPQAVQNHFWQALVRLYEAQQAERSLGWWRNKEIGLGWYVEEALKDLEASPGEASLIGSALQTAYFELLRHDALALAESRDHLLRGRAPLCADGIFAGEPLVIGFQLSPVVIPHLRNHPGNFVLQPATVWALQQDIVESANLSLVRRFRSAGLVPEHVVTTLTKELLAVPLPKTAEKND